MRATASATARSPSFARSDASRATVCARLAWICVGAHGRSDLLHRRGCLLKACRVLFGARRQRVIALGDLCRRDANGLRRALDIADHRCELRAHQAHRVHEAARVAAAEPGVDRLDALAGDLHDRSGFLRGRIEHGIAEREVDLRDEFVNGGYGLQRLRASFEDVTQGGVPLMDAEQSGATDHGEHGGDRARDDHEVYLDGELGLDMMRS